MAETSTYSARDVHNVDEAADQERAIERVQLFGIDLQRRAEREVALKQEVENRWIDDMRHYNGRYDRDTDARLNKAKNKTSSIFVNLTRSKTNTGESKLSDMILPTDDRNWGIKPTPVPDLVGQADNDDPVVTNTGQNIEKNDESGELYTYADLARVQMEDANKRSENMQAEIDDQLVESRYNPVCREIIHNAATLGTGVLKGPMIVSQTRKNWAQVGDGATHQLILREEKRPTVYSVDPWNFFPDSSATRPEDVEFVFERHMLTKKKVRDLAKHPGFMKSQVSDLLRQSPMARRTNLTYLNELREINGITQIHTDNRYEIWEYHGPLEKTDLMACGCKGIEEDDPLQEFEGVVWFSGGIVLKVALNPMDDDSLPYSIFNWEEDETSVFGFGVPYRMRGSQRVMNGSWRMLLDNAGLSTGPQIVLNRKVVEPANGDWNLTARKIWYLKNEKYQVRDAFATFDIQSNQEGLAAIFQMAHTLADEETNLPQLGNQMDPENQPAVMKTLGGTALWMTSQNITMRRAVKNWDDNITIPFITRMYYWNMQFNPKKEIKGDYDVDARGTSVLLVKEMQQRNMMEFIQLVYSNPNWQKYLKDRESLEQLAKSMQVPVGEVIKTVEEVKADEAADQGGQPDPEIMKLQLQREVAQMSLQEKQIETEGAIVRAQIQREVDLTTLAVGERKTLQEIQKDYNLAGLDQQWDREKFYKEIGIKQTEGQDANTGLE